MTTKWYGLTVDTVDTYRSFLGHGMSHDRAMGSLKRLYEHNKANHANPPDCCSVYGHPHWGGQTVLNGLQANKS